MILAFRHRGLERLFEKDDCRRISPELIAKIEHVLFRLDEASGPEDINLPGFGLHPLKGDLAGYWAAKCPATGASSSVSKGEMLGT